MPRKLLLVSCNYFAFKKVLFTALLLNMFFCGIGQQGVAINTTGTTSDASAMLDVSSSSKGLLVPRMVYADRILITSPATGLLVYQTNTSGTFGAGFWYNAGVPATPNWLFISNAVGTVTGVTASGVLASSGGAIPNITLTGIVPVANGGTNSSAALSGSGIMVSNGTAIVQGAGGTTTTVLHGNAAGVPTYSKVDLANDVTGVLPIANGGTNTNTIGAAGTIVYSNGTKQASTAAGTAGQVLTSAGTGAPVWSNLGQTVNTVFGTASTTITTSTTSFVTLTGLSFTTPNYTTATTVLISTDGGFYTNATTSNGYSEVDFCIYVDGVQLPAGVYKRLSNANAGANFTNSQWAISTSTVLAAGSTHVITVRAIYSAGSAATVGGPASGTNDFNQGELIVTVIKP